MDLTLPRAAVERYWKRRKWPFLLAAAGLTGYGAYKLYHLPSVSRKRRNLAKLFEAIVSVAEATASSSETVSLVSSDLNRFLSSNSDEIPTSLKQISKLTRSDEFAASLCSVSEAVTAGTLRGVQSGSNSESETSTGSEFSDRVLDRLFSSASTGFVSVVAGNFARGLVMGFYSSSTSPRSSGNPMIRDFSDVESDSAPLPGWVNLICGDEFRQLIGDSIQVFVSTLVAVYLEKTMHINTYDEIFAGLTNPEHEPKVKEMLVSVCNGAVETLVKTSHSVLTSSSDPNSMAESREVDIEQDSELQLSRTRRISSDGRVSSTLDIPSNWRFVRDVTGKVVFGTAKSLLSFVASNTYESAKRGANVVHAEIAERGLEIMRYASAKPMLILTICMVLCLHVFSRMKGLVSAKVADPSHV